MESRVIFMAKETAPRSPLGLWIKRMVKIKKLGTESALRGERYVKVSGTAWSNWSRADVSAVPEHAQLERIERSFKLTQIEREELREVLREQSKLRDEILEKAKTSPRSVALVPFIQHIPKKEERVDIEYDRPSLGEAAERVLESAAESGASSAFVYRVRRRLGHHRGETSAKEVIDAIKAQREEDEEVARALGKS